MKCTYLLYFLDLDLRVRQVWEPLLQPMLLRFTYLSVEYIGYIGKMCNVYTILP